MSASRTRATSCVAEVLEMRQLLSVAVYPTIAEQYMLELINRARANPAATAAANGIALNEGLAAGTISADAKQPVAFNPNLITAATNHTSWMLQTGNFAHDEGSVDPGTQMSDAGYAFTGSWTWGQNIAWSGTSPDTPPVNATTAQLEQNLFVDAGEPGRGHRVNLMNPQFQEIGIGVETGTFDGYNAVMATQDFAASGGGGGAFLTGAAYADANGNKFYDPGEGLGSVTVTATRTSDGATFSTTTWAAGGYTLALAPGTYNVTAGGTGLGNVSFGPVTIGSQNVEADFTPGMASKPPTPTPPTTTHTPMPVAAGWVTGMLFNDKNDNGTRDRGEGVLAGRRVFADLNGDGKWERGEPSAITNARGVYRLKLAPGSYAIREVPRGYWVPSTPANAEWDVTLDDGQTLTEDFANQFVPPVKARRTV